MKITSVSILILTLLLPALFSASLIKPCGSTASLTGLESNIVGLVDGTGVYNYDLELERIAFNHSLSKYSFRSAGSSGANATADWIIEQFQSFGLEAYKEPVQFTNWDVLSKPTLTIDDDGNSDSTHDQTLLSSFQSEHYSWPTTQTGVFADLVILPLPPAARRDEVGLYPIDLTAWNTIDTTGKIVLIGREVRFDRSWEQTYKDKLSAQTPAAVAYTWWYDWMNFTPPIHSSAGGLPASPLGSYYWDLGIPTGFVDYNEGLWIRNRESNLNVSARAKIEAVIGSGPHYNVIGKLTGYKYPDKFVIVSSHYDTVMCSGFSDNGAGTAGVIELARIFADAKQSGLLHPKYTILFIPFASEELGLVGSINYIMQHKAEMSDIVALINLDTLGSDNLLYTKTNPGDYFDLDELVLRAAKDLGITAQILAIGGDDEAFKNPANFGITDATPVNSSMSLMSQPGWIHTSYDNSTSTTTLNWVEPADLGDQIKVAALSIVRIVVETIQATVNIKPDTLNLRSRGKWISCYIELPEGYNVNDVDVSSLLLNDTVPANLRPISVGDYDRDSVQDLMVKFDRQAISDLILANYPLVGEFGTATLTIAGKLTDQTQFHGSATIKIKF